MRALAVLVVVVLLASVLLATAGPVRARPSGAVIKDLRLGEHWYGREITIDDLEGKVVLFVLWGS